jgi:hypothetical protein
VLRDVAASVAWSHGTHLRETRLHAICAWRRLSEGSTRSESLRTSSVGAMARFASHLAWWAHVVVGRRGHWGWVVLFDDHGRSGSWSATSQAVDIFSEVVVLATFSATAPVSSSERHRPVATSTAVMMMTTAVVMSVMARAAAIDGRTILMLTVSSIATRVRVDAGTCGGERATEAGCAALEVREAARGAVPVARTRSILGWRERSQDFCGAIKNSARGGRDLDGLLVECSAIHAKAFSSLDAVKH